MSWEDLPVYEADQVLTFVDLLAIRNGFVYEYKRLPWWRFIRRYQFKVAIVATDGMFKWLQEGKKTTEDKIGYGQS